MATIHASGTAGQPIAALLEQEWAPAFKLQCNEEAVIYPTFDKPEGVSKIGNLLHISKVNRVTPTAGVASNDSLTNLTFTANVETEIQVSPSFAYAAFEITKMVETRLLREPAYRAALRKQAVKGLITKKDSDAAFFASQLSNTKGGVGSNIDKTLLLDSIGTLILNSRDMFKPGNGRWAFLHYHPNQYKYVHNIAEIVSAQVRGDGEKVIQKGWVWDAYGILLSETGNVYTAAGVAHNMLHLTESHVYGLNADFGFLPEQPYQLATRIICYGEYGIQEQWDEYAVDIQTAA